MNDPEIRDALVTVCETLKAELRYLAALDRSLTRVYTALKSNLPELRKILEAPLEVHAPEHPGSVEQIQLIDALLEKLEKT